MRGKEQEGAPTPKAAANQHLPAQPQIQALVKPMPVNTGNYMETELISSAEVPAICLKEVEIKARCLWGRREGGGVKIILG